MNWYDAQMNAPTRSYDMRSRAAAVESTRERIVEAAQALFLSAGTTT